MSNVLIIGNGFDLAHKLPTRYSDYLNQLNVKSDFYNSYVNNHNEDEFKGLIKLINGKVCSYLISKKDENKGWIDFENECREIVNAISRIDEFFNKTIDMNKNQYLYFISKKNIANIPSFLIKYCYINNSLKATWEEEEINQMSKDVFDDLKSFIYYFEEYLTWVFDNIGEELPQIQFFKDLKIDYLLSFNYTSTYGLLYNNGYKGKKLLYDEDICYVHGEIGQKGKIVMGIGSEFYDETIHENCVELFKFFQRYKYNTDYKYQNWISNIGKGKIYAFDNIGKSNTELDKVIIYGHSMDPTDRDILFPFLNLKKVEINIYYLNDKDKLKIEKNLIKILRRKLFEEYLFGKNKRIFLKEITEDMS